MNLELVDPNKHANLFLRHSSDFSFARERSLVPVWGKEIPRAARSFPVLFVSKDQSWMPMALLGLEGKNRFLTDDGDWCGDYIPAVLRAHPFYSVESSAGKPMLGLMQDDPFLTEQSESSTRALPLFDEDGRPSALTQKALRILEQIRTQQEKTWALMDVLAELDVLVPWSGDESTVNDGSGGNHLYVVNEEKLMALSDEAFVKLRTPGLLALVYAHLFSLGQLPFLRGRPEQSKQNPGNVSRPKRTDDSLLFSGRESVFLFDDE